MQEEIGKAKSLTKRFEDAIVKSLVVLAKARMMVEVRDLSVEAVGFQEVSGSFLGTLKTIERSSTIFLERIPPKEVRVQAKPAETSPIPKPLAWTKARVVIAIQKKRGPAKAAVAKTTKKPVAKKKVGAKVSKKATAPKAKKPAVVKKPVVKKKAVVNKKKQKLLADIRAVVARKITDTDVVKDILRTEFGYKDVSGRTINGVRQTGVPKKKK